MVPGYRERPKQSFIKETYIKLHHLGAVVLSPEPLSASAAVKLLACCPKLGDEEIAAWSVGSNMDENDGEGV